MSLNEMLHRSRVTHVLCAIWDVEFDGDIHFKFDLRKRQCQVKLGQIFQFKISFQKYTYLILFCMRNKQYHLF